jgi:ring-1,2-phenylacetyl-CoA epoxidase subunit PaaC
VSKQALTDYTIHLADNALILGQRNSEWTGHGPILEQDIALSNIALDLIGQARLFYQYAAQLQGNGATEDTIAYLRDSGEFKNCLITELDKGDWAKTVLRQFFFSTYQWYLYRQLQNSKDIQLAAIAEKALKEVAYHLRWSGEWVVRLGDGTEESHRRMLTALAELWSYTGELTHAAPYEQTLAAEEIAVDPSSFKNEWLSKINEVLQEATLPLPVSGWMQNGGKEGKHTEHLGYILAEMQYLQRAYPGCEW